MLSHVRVHIKPFGVYEHGNEKGYGVSKYFHLVPRRRCRVLLYCGTAAIRPGELYEIIVLIQLEK